MTTFQNPTSLSLELLCGSDEVDSGHPGFLPTAKAKQTAIRDRLALDGIEVRVQQTFDHGSEFSDAYVYFEESQLGKVAEAVEAAAYEGDILDVLEGSISSESEAIARRQGWQIEN